MPTKPRSLRIVTVLLLGLGVGFAVALLLAPFDFPIYSVNDQAMGGLEFTRMVGVPIGLMSVTFCLAGWALFRNRSWSRFACIFAAACFGFAASWVAAIAPAGQIIAPHLLGTPLFVGLATWYLYFARGPKEYYAALSGSQRSGA